MSTSEVIIRLAVKEDYQAIKEGFEQWFWPYEPLSVGYKIKTPSISEKEMFLALPEDKGMTLVATIPDKGEKIVGILMIGPNYPGLDQEIADNAGDAADERFKAYFGISRDLEDMVDIFKRYNVNKSFHLMAVAIDPKQRGKNIGYKLFERAFKMAKEMGYKIVSVDCTSKYSANIARRLNMDEITSIEYKEYKDSEGKPIFTPPPEHTHMIRFIKEL